MGFLEIADYFIPGFSSLAPEKKKAFKDSNLGKQFVEKVKEALDLFKKIPTSRSWRNFFLPQIEDEQKIREKLATYKTEIVNALTGQPEYESLITEIIGEILANEYADFHLLTKEQQTILAKADFSQILAEMLLLNEAIGKASKQFTGLDAWQKANIHGRALQDELAALHAQKEKLIEDWQRRFFASEDPSMDNLRKTIDRGKQHNQLQALQLRAKDLSEFFPLINYLGRAEEFSRYLGESYEKFAEPNQNFEVIEKTLLTEYILLYLQRLTLPPIDYFNLTQFNEEQAQIIANNILQVFNKQKKSLMENWLDCYAQNLTEHIKQQMLSFNGEEWELTYEEERQQLLNSLSYLFWNNRVLTNVTAFMNKLADAHSFIQATGFATQNENSLLAILDIYNYGRTSRCVTETKTILASVLKPFYPLYREYKDIAFYEKNHLRKIFRVVMPLVIIAAFIALVALLFTSELALTAALIPTLFLGIALATYYVSVKDKVYNFLREAYYGGPFAIPEFQVNARMKQAFNGEENATKIRNFYVDELKSCRDEEAHFYGKYKQGLLNEDEIEGRKENTERMNGLLSEYYDISENSQLGCDQVLPRVIAKRWLEELQHLKQEYNQIYADVNQVIEEEKRSIHSEVVKRPPSPPLQNGSHSMLFFKPDYPQHHSNLDGMAKVLREMRN